MSFRTALDDTYTAPLTETRNRLVKQLEELVPQAWACSSYNSLRSICARNQAAWALFRNAHFEHKVNPDMDSRRLSDEVKLKIALTALQDIVEYDSYLVSPECDKASVVAERKLAERKSQPMHPYAWADSPEEYYGGGTPD